MILDIFMYSKYGMSNVPSLLANYTKEFENILEYPDFQLACNEYIKCQLNSYKYLIDLYPSTFNGTVSISPETSLDLVRRYDIICNTHKVAEDFTGVFLNKFEKSLTEKEKEFLLQCTDRILMHKYEIFYELRDKHALECIRDGVEMQYWNFYDTSITLAFNNLEIPIPFREKPWLLLVTNADFVLDPEGGVAHRNSFNIRTLDIHTKRMENWDIERRKPVVTQLRLNGKLYKSIDGKTFVDENMMMYPKIPQFPVVNSIENNPIRRMLDQRITESEIRLERCKVEALDKHCKMLDRKFYNWANTNFSLNLNPETHSRMFNEQPRILPQNQSRMLPQNESRMLPPSNNSK